MGEPREGRAEGAAGQAQSGGRPSRTRIVESILDPSRTIAPQYATLAVALRDGRVLIGLTQPRTARTQE